MSKKKKKKKKAIREFELDQFVRDIKARTMMPVVLEHYPGTDCFEAKVYSAAGLLEFAVASATLSEAIAGLHYVVHHEQTSNS